MPPVHANSKAVRDELKNRSVLTKEDAEAGFEQFGPILASVSEQVAKVQGLISRARMTEKDEAVKQKFNGLIRACKAVQNQHDKTQDNVWKLVEAMEMLERETEELAAEIQRVEQGLEETPNPSPGPQR